MSDDKIDDEGVIRARLTAVASMFLDQIIWFVLLVGLVAAAASVVVPGSIGGAVCVGLAVLGIVRCSTMRVVVDGQHVVVVNALRTHRFERAAIASCDVVVVRRVPPRIRLSIDAEDGRTSFNLDATARVSRRARRRLADQLLAWGVVTQRCAREYAELKY